MEIKKMKKMLAIGAIGLVTSLATHNINAMTTFTQPTIVQPPHSIYTKSSSKSHSEVYTPSEEEILLYKIFGLTIGALAIAALGKAGHDGYKKLTQPKEKYIPSHKRI